MDTEQLQTTLWGMVPFNKLLGVKVVTIEAGKVTLSLAARPEVSNHVGTLHAAALFGLGEGTAGAAVLIGLSDLIAAGWVPLARNGRISYTKPVSGEARSIAQISPAEGERLRSEAPSAEKLRLTVPVSIFTPEGLEASTFEVDFVLIHQGPRA